MKPICDYLEENRIKWSERPYISVREGDGFVSRTFRQVTEDVQSLAKALIARGIRGNVMLYAQNSYQWAAADLALMGYVGVCVPIDREWTAHDVCHVLSAVDVSAIFYERDRAWVIGEAEKQFPGIRCLCLEDCFEQLIQEGRAVAGTPEGRRNREETAMILFTSGTTNRPKAIPLTQANLLHNWDALYRRIHYDSGDAQ